MDAFKPAPAKELVKRDREELEREAKAELGF